MAKNDSPTRPKKQPPEVNLNLNVRGMSPSATVAINEQSNAMRSEGKQVHKLGLGQSPFPVPENVVETLRQHAHEKDYLPVKGLWDLRRAVAEYHRRTDGLGSTAEDVLIGPGSKELMFILQLVYYGDLVIPTPSWVSYAPQAEIIGRKVRWMSTTREDGWMLRPDALAKLCEEDPGRPRLVILNYPSNPTGGSYTIDELKEMAKVARENKVLLLSDEIYGELHYRDQHVSIARFYPEGTIVSAGLSKWCGAGGWRLGTFLFPRQLRWLLDAMATVASETYTSTSAPIQYAAVRAFEGGLEIEHYLRDSRRLLNALCREACKRMQAAGIDVQVPRGAFYLFPDFSPLRDRLSAQGITSSVELCARVLSDTGVAFLPGASFGRPEEELTARMALVDFDGARALTACESLPPSEKPDLDFLQTYCGNVIDAVDKLCEWVRNA
jgi:aspartate aminotransferase